MLHGLAARIEHAGYLHKAVITLEASAPDHRGDAMLARIQRQDGQVWHPRRDRLGRIVGGGRSIEAMAGNVIVDVPPCLGGGLVAEPDILADVVRESKSAIGDASETTEQHNSLRAQRLQTYGVACAEQRPRRKATIGTNEVLAWDVI